MAITVKKLIERAWNGEVVEVGNDFNEKKNEIIENLRHEGIVVDIVDGKKIASRYDKFPKMIKKNQFGHKYIMPKFADEVRSFFHEAMNGNSFNILLTGAAGTGKSEFVREICSEFGYKVFQVNGRDDMDSSDFFGEKTVEVDQNSRQNYVKFNKGPLYRAFIEGTELDEDGDQILYNEDGTVNHDGSGTPKVIGKPGLFFLDEFAAIMPGVFLSVFNRAMEIPRQVGMNRSIEISADGGKIVKSHPAFAMMLAGNTIGKGTESESQMGYTAQNNMMDDSTLDRITATYKFGYNLNAEMQIMYGKFNDDHMVANLVKFRDEIRKQWQNGNVETLLSTRAIVQICNLANMFRNSKVSNPLPLSIYRSTFSSLRERETPAWNESIRMVFGVDVMREYGNSKSDMFFAEKC